MIVGIKRLLEVTTTQMNVTAVRQNTLRSSSTSQKPQNVAFVSSNSTNSNSSTNEADNTAYGVSVAHTQSNPTSGDNLSDVVICAFLASEPNSPQLSQEDLEQIDPDGLEEIDLQWEMAMLTIRARRFIKRTGRKLDVNGQRVGFDRSKVECYNCHKNGHFARKCRLPMNQEKRGKENNRRTVSVETPTENALVAQDGIGGYDWSYQAEEEHPINFALMAFTSSGSSSSSDSEVDSCSKSYVKAYATLKEQYDSLSSNYKKCQFHLVSYKAVLPWDKFMMSGFVDELILPIILVSTVIDVFVLPTMELSTVWDHILYTARKSLDSYVIKGGSKACGY
ncbi:ribonuclease H-like domain-containing protein [Tanacetum coccineum]